MATTVTNRSPFIAQLLAPIGGRQTDRRFLAELRREAELAWRLVCHRYWAALALRDHRAQGTVSAVQQSIDAINVTLSQTASQTVVTAQEIRLTAAEQTLQALDGASISQAVSASRSIPANSDATGEGNILALLNGETAKQVAQTGIAQARTDLNARVDGAFAASAVLSVQLAVQIGTVTAQIATETATRISGDQASATSLASYRAANDGAVGTLTTSVGTLTTNLSTLSASVTALSSTVGGQTGQIASINATLATQATTNTSTANAITGLQSSVGGLTGSLATVNSTLTTQAMTNTAFAGQISTIGTTLNGHTTTLTSYGQSIDGIGGKYGFEFNNNGVVTGAVALNGSGRTDITFIVNGFRIAQPDGTSARTVFNIADDGVTEMQGIRVNTLEVNTAVVPAFASSTTNIGGSG